MIDSFWGNIFRRQDQETESIRKTLRKIPIFQGLSKNELKAVERILHRREYKADETGKVQVFFEPTQQVIAELHDGDFFGELALLDDSPRSATVIARIDCKMLGFFKPDLLDLIQRNPRLGTKIILQLSTVIGRRLTKSNEQVQALQIKLHRISQKRKLDPEQN
jgi:CRP-like cAMP-binding protein